MIDYYGTRLFAIVAVVVICSFGLLGYFIYRYFQRLDKARSAIMDFVQKYWRKKNEIYCYLGAIGLGLNKRKLDKILSSLVQERTILVKEITTEFPPYCELWYRANKGVRSPLPVRDTSTPARR